MEAELSKIEPRGAPIHERPPVAVAGQQLMLFVDSPPLVARLVDDIRQARSRVWLETYIFAADGAGLAVGAALADRARAGLDVRLLYDAIGSQATPAALFGELESAGVQVHAYHSLLYALRRFSFFDVLNRRNHRKLVVVDDRVAYFGGMNIVDTRVGDATQASAAAAAADGWRDVHVRLAGSQVGEVGESFERSWRRAHHLPLARRTRKYRRGQVPAEGGEYIRFFDSGPGRKFTRATRVFTRLLRLSRRSILLSMAYFLPTPGVLRAIVHARHAGSDVHVIVPGESDVPLVQAASRHMYDKLLAHGIAIHERQARMLHSKVMVVDGQWTVVGSANLDPRSLEINLEFLAVVRSAAFASEVAGICRDEIRNSHLVTLDDCNRRGRWRRLLDWAAYLFRAWL